MRVLTRTNIVAEVYLAAGGLIGAVTIWVGLALDTIELVYAGVAVIACEPLASFFNAPAPSPVGANTFDERARLMAFSYKMLTFQFLCGVGVFAIADWPTVTSTWEQLKAAEPAARISLFIEFSEGPKVYGLYAVLWFQTILGVLLGSVAAVVQTIQYETGKERPDQWDTPLSRPPVT